MTKQFSFLCLALLTLNGWPSAAQPATREEQIAVCTQHLQAIGRAIRSYVRDRDAMPAYLSDLYPRYITNKNLFHCPADDTPGSGGVGNVADDPKLPISYLYEMSADRTPFFGLLSIPLTDRQPMSLLQVKMAQLNHFGDWVPVLRCWHHQMPLSVLNLALTGQVYPSGTYWETEPEVLTTLLSRLQNDMRPGPQQCRSSWPPVDVVEYFTFLRHHGDLEAALRNHMGALADEIDQLPQKDTTVAQEDADAIAGSLYYAAGYNDKALTTCERAAAGLGRNGVLAAYMLEDLFQTMGRNADAIHFFQQEVDRNPQENALMQLLANAYERAGQKYQAARWRGMAEGNHQLIGAPAPDFTLPDQQGHPVHLAELRGKVVLLNFWTLGTGPGRAQAPHLEALYQQHRKQGVVVIGLNQDPEKEKASEFARKTVTYPVLLEAGAVFNTYAVTQLPATFLVDPAGKIIARYDGYGPGQEDLIAKAIKPLVGN